MRAIIFSDTHGNYNGAISIIKNIGKVDCIIHCGDMLKDCLEIKKTFPDIPFYYVCGNNDFDHDIPKKLEIELDGKKVFITHGHLYNVRSTEDRLKDIIDEGFDIVLYGHTHISNTTYYKNGIILNPGALKYCCGTYGIIEIEGSKIGTAILQA